MAEVPIERGTATERTEWSVRYSSPYGSHITTCQDEKQARRWASAKPQKDCTIELLRRQVSITEWVVDTP